MNDAKKHQWILIILTLAIVVAVAGLLARCYYELSGVMYGDTMIFQTVGRGMLNGLKPYSGLFETKPPGIFMMHALSLWLFDSQLLVKILQVLALLTIPVMVFIPAVHFMSERSAKQRQVLTLTSILFGIVLALYTGDQAGMGLTESYGVAAVLLYLFFLCRPKPNILLLGVFILIAVGLKEPFLLIILSCVLLLKKNLLHAFVYPLLVAVFMGLSILFALGYLEPFFSVYLPHMFGFHVYQHNVPLPIRALEVWRTFINIGAYSWWLAGCITVLWISSFSRATALRLLTASYLFFLAIAVGGDFYGHHFVFAVPCYVVMYWLLLQGVERSRWWIKVFALLLVLSVFQTRFIYHIDEWHRTEADHKAVASVIDSVMDDCGYDRYIQMIARGGGPYAYTKHSPAGPIFVHYSRFIGGSPMYQSAYISALQNAPLAFVLDIDESNFTDIAKEMIRENFSENAPACAGEDFVQPSPYHLLFRLE
ncbi:hypothetical protein HOL63_01230 [Candidatus Peregrinibacteria bacterium]|nr:hypothetical protein [Candidatus Peregrinibacteria bacterium]MBT5468429.1 hypothetical protein [Candidatus Peregrinibacteria bacterium]